MDSNSFDDDWSIDLPSSNQSTVYESSKSFNSSHYPCSFSTAYSPLFDYGYLPSFDSSSPSSFNGYDTSFSTQDSFNSFASQSEYGNFQHHDPTASYFETPVSETPIKYEFDESRTADMTTSPMDCASSADISDTDHADLLSSLLSIVTHDNIKILHTIAQDIRDTVDDGLTKRNLLVTKIKGIKRESNSSSESVFVSVEAVKAKQIKEEWDYDDDRISERMRSSKTGVVATKKRRGGRTAGRKVANRRGAALEPPKVKLDPPRIKPPRLSSYATKEDHDIALSEYLADLKNRHQLKGYETLAFFTKSNIARLMDRLTRCNLLEIAANDFLEGRASLEQCVELKEVERFIEDAGNDVRDVYECFSQLDNVGL